MKMAFEELDDEGLGYIDHMNIDRFLKKSGFAATDEELTSIIRRLDVWADSKVSYPEFEEAMMPAGASSRSSKDYKLSNPSIVKLENLSKGYFVSDAPPKQKEVEFSKYDSPLKYESPTKKYEVDEFPISRSYYGKK